MEGREDLGEAGIQALRLLGATAETECREAQVTGAEAAELAGREELAEPEDSAGMRRAERFTTELTASLR